MTSFNVSVSPASSRPSTKRQPTGGKVDQKLNHKSPTATQESAYISFFRLLSLKDPYLDRVSLLACNNQGITATELWPTPSLEVFAKKYYNGQKSPMRILRSVSPSPVKGISSKSAERLRSHSSLGGGYSSEERSPSSRSRSKIQNDNLEEDLLLTSAYKLQCERATLKFKVVQKERARLVEILMSGANERMAREEKENEMMRRPKRLRKIVPGILLNHEENTLHAQLTAQETDDQKLRRASMLELRKAMLVGDATIDESMGDNIPGMLDAGIDPVILKHLDELRLEAEQATAEKNSLDVENEPKSATQYATPYPLSPRAIQSRRRKLHISRDLAEREAVRTLLSVQSSSQESEAKFETDMALIARRGQEKIEKIRKRHMNTLVDEISRIQERDELLAHLEEREVVWREMNAERKRELHEKVVAADLLRNEKIAQHEAEAERVTSERKAKLQNNIDRRDERLALIEAENESERNKRMAELELSMQEARERLAAREVELKTKADLQRDETAAKMSLHGSRKNNLLTRRDVLFATLSSESQKKQVEAYRRREGRGNAYAESLETTITAREAEARARRTIHKQNRKDFLRKQVEDNDLRTMAAGVNRDEDEQFKQQWRDAIDEDWEDKKALVDMQAADRDRDCKLKQALTTLKEEAHSENMQRLERVTEYTYSVKKSVVEAQAAHTEMKKKVAEHHREELRQNRMFMAHKQEIVQSSIVTMMNGNKFPTKRDELEAVIESMSPENKKKQHQLENARRELQQAKQVRDRQQIDGSAPHNTHQLPPSRGTRASSPITQPTSLTFLDSYMNEGSNSFSSPVDEIIKRIRRSR